MRKLHVIVPAGVLIWLFAAAGPAAAGPEHGGPAAPQSADDGYWCGFHPTADSRVECGYSSYSECHEKATGKDTICIPDPDHAELKTRLSTPAG